MDPWGGDPHAPLTLHKYLYIRNNPGNGADPTGLFEGTIIGLLINFAVKQVLVGMRAVAIGGAIGAIFGGADEFARGGSFWEGAKTGSKIGAAFALAFQIKMLRPILTAAGVAFSILALQDALQKDNFDLFVFRSVMIVAPIVAIAAVRGIVLSRGRIPRWPRTSREMDEFLGFDGERIADTPSTSGRNKVIWRPSENIKITCEGHPYDVNAPEWHKDLHWHLDTPGGDHIRYVPGEPIPPGHTQ